jgi:hypothetical protein
MPDTNPSPPVSRFDRIFRHWHNAMGLSVREATERALAAFRANARPSQVQETNT